mgnify:CR=1 FL=1
MLTEADMIEAMGYYRAGDDAKLLELFQRFDFYDWETPECNEWKKHHAQEFSDFIQYVMDNTANNIHANDKRIGPMR